MENIFKRIIKLSRLHIIFEETNGSLGWIPEVQTTKSLQELNNPIADRVLADIQNGILTKVKGEQIQHKKAVKNKINNKQT